jgi:hypothetical protein
MRILRSEGSSVRVQSCLQDHMVQLGVGKSVGTGKTGCTNGFGWGGAGGRPAQRRSLSQRRALRTSGRSKFIEGGGTGGSPPLALAWFLACSPAHPLPTFQPPCFTYPDEPALSSAGNRLRYQIPTRPTGLQVGVQSIILNPVPSGHSWNGLLNYHRPLCLPCL